MVTSRLRCVFGVLLTSRFLALRRNPFSHTKSGMLLPSSTFLIMKREDATRFKIDLLFPPLVLSTIPRANRMADRLRTSKNIDGLVTDLRSKDVRASAAETPIIQTNLSREAKR